MANQEAQMSRFDRLLPGSALAGALVLVVALGLAAAPSYAAWRRVSAHRTKNHPYFACGSQRRVRCHLITDPTRDLHRSGRVSAGAITAGPELETSPALQGTGEEGGYSPEDLRKAYKLPSTTAGSGQTVAIVDAYDDPRAEADLSTYRSHYGLAACTTASGCFRKVNQNGGSSPRPGPSAEWSEEISLDLDMVSAICPNCHILLVEAETASSEDLAAAANEAVALGATEVSNSYGSVVGEEKEVVSAYDHPGVPITVAAGDEGYRVEEPADYPQVIAVGGTSLLPASNKRGWKETVWYGTETNEKGELEVYGTGSGCSNQPKPTWQTDTGCSFRTNNDVAAVADQNTPVSTYDTYKTETEWNLEGGTSVATPIVAAAMALSNSYTRSFLGAHALYVDALLNENAFNDVTEGSNGKCAPPTSHAYLCTAEPGYDGPSGLGTLNGAPEAPAPVLVTKPAAGIGAGEATLNATIDPNDASFTKCRFEYGLTTSYGSSVTAPCPPESPESGTGTVPITVHLTGLSPASTYHFRVSATYQGQSGTGSDSSFTTSGAPPSVVTETASSVETGSATLKGKVDPNGAQVTECRFEYGKSSASGSAVPCTVSGAGQSFVAVSASVAGLAPEQTYHFRLIAKNASGEGEGSELAFTTRPELPAVDPEPATEVTATGATLHGTVDPEGPRVTECRFEYGTSPAYGASAPCATEPGEGQTPRPVAANVAGLLAGHSYYFRVVAGNSHGDSVSGDDSFTTPAEPPSALTESATASGTSSATLTGTVVPNGAPLTTCRFEYGTSPAGVLEASSPCSSLPASSEEEELVSASITGLAAGTVYHYRLVATNSTGSSSGATLSFATDAPTLQGNEGLEQLTGGHAQPGPGVLALATRKLSANAHGTVAVPVKCPAESSSCTGTMSLQVVKAVRASRRARAVRHHVLLAAGVFKVRGGQNSTIRLQLSRTARTLVRRAGVLHASATITPAAGSAARVTVAIRAR
jgi:Subtilase family